MTLHFPPDFIFGTSTSAAQIETAFNHDWQGVRSHDGSIFDRTTDHEKRCIRDIEIISSLAPHYRMSLMWSRLQREPYGTFHPGTKNEYHALLKGLRRNGVSVMMVLHHWVHPIWFSEKGGWTHKDSKHWFLDFARKLVDEFGCYVSHWNTFNEPNLYTTLSFLAGEFPPYKKRVDLAFRVARHLSQAHAELYRYIQLKYPNAPCGVSINAASFQHTNPLGRLAANLADYWYMDYLPSLFEHTDFTGISYYAKVRFDPKPITFLLTPEKIRELGVKHDDIWEYYPMGLAENVRRFYTKYKKPIYITENGFCSNDDSKRVQAIRDYMHVVHQLLAEGVPVRGYFHWSTWDNFEWNLGPSFRFGLYHCDPVTMERSKKPSAELYANLAYNKVIEV